MPALEWLSILGLTIVSYGVGAGLAYIVGHFFSPALYSQGTHKLQEKTFFDPLYQEIIDLVTNLSQRRKEFAGRESFMQQVVAALRKDAPDLEIVSLGERKEFLIQSHTSKILIEFIESSRPTTYIRRYLIRRYVGGLRRHAERKSHQIELELMKSLYKPSKVIVAEKTRIDIGPHEEMEIILLSSAKET